MARTRLFGALERAFREAGPPHPRALSRRSFLVMSAALAACQATGPGENVAIVGAGAAGLTIAYRLAKAGRAVTLYEASDRLGGRMFTRKNFNEDGQFCELGGELVDTNHEKLRALAAELGVPIDRLAPETDPGEELFHISGRLHSAHELFSPAGRGAFNRLAARIKQDSDQLLDSAENWTEHATALDNESLHAYLARVSNLAPRWTMQLLELAYRGEYGIPTEEQSALNFVDFIGTDAAQGFKLFGDSDETSRIRGGSSTLTDALAQRLDAHVTINRQHALATIGRTANGITLSFDAPSGRVAHEHARVVLALPFTKLRQVGGIETLGLSDVKLKAIRELGYGDNSKLMVSTQSRPWKTQHFPAPAKGEFFSDRFQCVWDTSRGQEGDRGILTNFLTNQRDRDAALANMRNGFHQFSRDTETSLDAAKTAWMDWSRQPFALGSYAGAKIGQYTTLLPETATPSTDGRIQFAGEHTSVDFIGFMNGAVESGERVAAALLGA